MSGSYPGNLRVWEAWNLTDVAGRTVPEPCPNGDPSRVTGDETARLYARETLRSPASAIPAEELSDPYSLQWFLHVESQRHRRYAKWIPRLLEFTKHAGETLLGLGDGLATDWVQYARHGASVIVCSPAAADLELARRNFEQRGLAGRFLHAGPAALPLESASIDVACVNTLLQADPAAVVDEVHRILKPGGKVLVLAPARYDLHYWSGFFFPWQRQPERPAGRYSVRQLRRLFGRFRDHRIHKRHLRRADVPHVWRWLPLPLLERLFGQFLILKAFKPLSAALPLAAAAA